jgi:outer membrane cobalamin receptor
MNRYFYAFLLAFTFSAIPAIAQEDSARAIEEVVITALRKETNSARYCDYYYCDNGR